MPIFEYRCSECNEVNEFIVLGKAEILSCTKCGSQNLVKLMSAHNAPGSGRSPADQAPSGCCGAPGSCSSPGSCCS